MHGSCDSAKIKQFFSDDTYHKKLELISGEGPLSQSKRLNDNNVINFCY